MAHRLPLSLLRVFEAAARLPTFRAAAAELMLSPSAVSHAIRELERRIRAPLFLRSTRRVEVTPEGRALFGHVTRGFDELQRGLDSVTTASRSSLRLHCAPSFAGQWLGPRLAAFLLANPKVELKLSASQNYPLFPSEEFDADIIYGSPRQTRLNIVPLGMETVAPLCAPSLALRIRSIGDLMGATLIESEHKRVRWPAWFEANGQSAPQANGPRFDRSYLSIAAAVEGVGVALESTRLAERELLAGKLVRPLAGRTLDVDYVGHYLVYPLGGERQRALQRFVAWLGHELHLPDGRKASRIGPAR